MIRSVTCFLFRVLIYNALFFDRSKDTSYGSRKDRDDENERDDWDTVDKPKQSEGYDSIKPLEDRYVQTLFLRI